jgi:type I restriction enzyme S subunit
MELKQGYKQTEVGLIPEDWGITELGKIGVFAKGSGVRKDQSNSGEIACVRYGELYTKHNNYIKTFHSFISKEVSLQAKKLKKGDILFAGSGETKAEIGKSAAFIDDIDAYAGGDIVILTPKGFDSLYLGYLLNASLVQAQKASRGQGDAVVHINSNNLSSIKIPQPTLKEQTAIANALSEMDALINQTEKLIEKKKAIKQGAMQELLKPKDGWVTKKLGDVGKCHRGVSYNPEVDLHNYDKNNTIRLLRSNNIQQQSIELAGLQFVDQSRVKPNQILQENDIVICMANGSKQLVGKAGVFSKSDHYSYTFGAFMGCFRTEQKFALPAFIALNFQTYNYRNYIDVLLSGSSINNLNPSNIESIEISLPTISDQLLISNIIGDMDKEIANKKNKLTKLKQQKLGMMQALLTGKIRLVS